MKNSKTVRVAKHREQGKRVVENGINCQRLYQRKDFLFNKNTFVHNCHIFTEPKNYSGYN